MPKNLTFQETIFKYIFFTPSQEEDNKFVIDDVRYDTFDNKIISINKYHIKKNINFVYNLLMPKVVNLIVKIFFVKNTIYNIHTDLSKLNLIGSHCDGAGKFFTFESQHGYERSLLCKETTSDIELTLFNITHRDRQRKDITSFYWDHIYKPYFFLKDFNIPLQDDC